MMKYRCYILLSLVSGAFTKISLRAQSNLSKCKRIFVHMHNSWRWLKSFFPHRLFGDLALNLLKFRDTIAMLPKVCYFW